MAGMDDSAARLRDLLDPLTAASVAEVGAFWRAHATERGRWPADCFRALARWLVQAGEPLLAFDVSTEGLQHLAKRSEGGSDPVLRRLQAHALARTGARWRANALLTALRDEGCNDEETLGLLASTFKDRALEARPGSPVREACLREALETYESAHRGGYWTGINIAALRLLLGHGEAARAAAADVEAICREELSSLGDEAGERRYWNLATLGEAALLRGRWEEACRWYSRAVETSGRKWGNVATTRRQARLILAALRPAEAERELIEECLHIPAVAVFAGHQVDRPDREMPRFPPALEDVVREALEVRLREAGVGFGYSSGAMGADLVFQECLRDQGAETHLILPYMEPEFIRDSVAVGGEGWTERFNAVRRHASEVITTSRHALDWGGALYAYTNALILGRARMRAEELQTRLVPIAVWDGRPGDGPGGTAAAVELWRKHGHSVEILRLDELARDSGLALRPEPRRRAARTLPPIPTAPSPPVDMQIRSILFADLVDFSALSERQIYAFFREVLHRIAEFAAETPYEPQIRNTWGDGLFCVFDRAGDAAHFALGLQRIFRETDWSRYELPENLSLRIGLHAGPAFFCTDPVTTRPTYLGTHVNLASRIEPETAFQEIFASWAFAALARVEGVDDIQLDYVGRLPLQRVDEPLPTYRLTAAHEHRHDVEPAPEGVERLASQET